MSPSRWIPPALVSLLALTTASLTLASVATPRDRPRKAEDKPPPNVLFLVVDDLRPDFLPYADTLTAPNLTRLAGQGTTFLRAYASVALCSPSRVSLLTGLRPQQTRIYNCEKHFRDTIPDVVTLPQRYLAAGYNAVAMGKIYHGGLDDPASWSQPLWEPDLDPYGAPLKVYGDHAARMKDREERGPAWVVSPRADDQLYDGALADHAVAALAELKQTRDQTGQPFFLAVGFKKPHLPFVAPEAYWDAVDPGALTLASNPEPPEGVPEIALHPWGELRRYEGMPKEGPVSAEQAQALVHGYHAAALYMDAQLGRVLDALDDLHLREDTIVVAWGDHGWSLGEHGLWCKHTNFEEATHAPLILVVPGQKAPGQTTRALTEFVDVYPTLLEASGLPAPEGLPGRSLLPLTDDPSRAHKDVAYSQYKHKGVLGTSARTDRYRYTTWGEAGVELYDHQVDPGENVNVAQDPAYADVVAELGARVRRDLKGKGR